MIRSDDGGVETREGSSGGDPSATMKLSLQDDNGDDGGCGDTRGQFWRRSFSDDEAVASG
jgi:hypothetical protein